MPPQPHPIPRPGRHRRIKFCTLAERTQNSKRYGVENGCLGTVVGVDTAHRTLIVKLDKGKRVIIPTTDYAHLKLGYAVTTHKAQGLTTENAYVLLGGW